MRVDSAWAALIAFVTRSASASVRPPGSGFGSRTREGVVLIGVVVEPVCAAQGLEEFMVVL